jgi:hypothetical protein
MTGSSDKVRESNDYYPTPAWFTERLLEVESFAGTTVWEPACGDGAISKLLIAHGAGVESTDLYDRGYGQDGIDFLLTPGDVENIVTNPPYKLARQFVEHALLCASDRVVMCCKLNFLAGQRRAELFASTPLRTVYVSRKRVSFDKGTVKGNDNGVLEYAWFVWQQGYAGKPMIEWV